MSPVDSAVTSGSRPNSVRLHYLDTLRVLAVFMVFLYHATMPFTMGDPDIANAERSLPASIVFSAFLAPWGMPFFFLLAGAATWFALQHRTTRQYVGERFRRLIVPFLVGSLLLTSLQAYFNWLFRLRVGTYQGSYLEFMFVERFQGWNPTIFDWMGYHLWFLAYLFVVALLLMPLLQWLRTEAGGRSVSRLAALCEHRGGVLLYALPLLVAQIGLRPTFPQERNWADFVYYLLYFLGGYLIYADERITRAIRRDRWLALSVGIVALLGLLATVALGEAETLFSDPGNPGFRLFWACAAVDAWCWSVFMLSVGMRSLDFDNAWTQYGQEAIVPFYVLHQPVIYVVAFYVVQWQVSVTVKMLAVIVIAFAATAAIYAMFIRRIAPLRLLFGMKATGAPPTMARSKLSAS
jgi:glucan biosynthesis protein C